MPINIIDPKPIQVWLAEMSAGDDGIACWLQKAFSKALKKREESAAPLREWPKNPPAWMKPGETYHEFSPDPALKETVSYVRDWLATFCSAGRMKDSLNNLIRWTPRQRLQQSEQILRERKPAEQECHRGRRGH